MHQKYNNEDLAELATKCLPKEEKNILSQHESLLPE